MDKIKSWTVYVILTDKGQFYTGITTDINRRWAEHLAVAMGSKKAKGARYFRTQVPLSIHYLETCQTRSQASKREASIKALSHSEKEALAKAT